jgi:oligopeptide/dipeptide ABC transporter ATP-binding protein
MLAQGIGEIKDHMSTPLLEIKNLTKYFPVKGGVLGRTIARVHAVDDVSLAVKPGETLGLVGESGCGKSTLGRTLLRLYEPTSGQINFQGEDILKLSTSEMRKRRRDMQIIFQDPFSSLNPRMNVGSILAEPFHIHKLGTKSEIQKKIPELLDIVGLSSEAADRYPHEFSGGQRQRIGIARAIALNPKLIVADEPVSALDVSIQSQILNLLVDLRGKMGLSYIFIAHDLAVIEHISDSVAVMYLGKIVEYTDGDQLYAKPTHPYTRALIAAIPEPDVNIKKEKVVLKGDVPSPINPPSGCHFHPRCPIATSHCKTEPPKLRNLGTDQKPHMVSCHNV